jgi:RHS repeat-associated protein
MYWCPTQRGLAYGTTRGSSGTLPTDRTFTGQKQDSTGLMYLNARYYDSALGQFLSPDTVVPDAGVVLDYNRYMYVRGNPLKYTDPTGHCAVLEDGSPDIDGDAGCWVAADEWYATFGGGDYETEAEWRQYFASQSGITESILRARLTAYWGPQYMRWGIHHPRYNPAPTWNEPPPHPMEGLGDTIAPLIFADCSTRDCVAVAINAVGVTGASLTLASPACGPFMPECAVAGRLIGNGATIVGLGWTIVQGTSGNVSNADALTVGFTSGVSLTTQDPRVGLVASVGQFLWDTFVAPFDSWR